MAQHKVCCVQLRESRGAISGSALLQKDLGLLCTSSAMLIASPKAQARTILGTHHFTRKPRPDLNDLPRMVEQLA